MVGETDTRNDIDKSFSVNNNSTAEMALKLAMSAENDGKHEKAKQYLEKVIAYYEDAEQKGSNPSRQIKLTAARSSLQKINQEIAEQQGSTDMKDQVQNVPAAVAAQEVMEPTSPSASTVQANLDEAPPQVPILNQAQSESTPQTPAEVPQDPANHEYQIHVVGNAKAEVAAHGGITPETRALLQSIQDVVKNKDMDEMALDLIVLLDPKITPVLRPPVTEAVRESTAAQTPAESARETVVEPPQRSAEWPVMKPEELGPLETFNDLRHAREVLLHTLPQNGADVANQLLEALQKIEAPEQRTREFEDIAIMIEAARNVFLMFKNREGIGKPLFEEMFLQFTALEKARLEAGVMDRLSLERHEAMDDRVEQLEEEVRRLRAELDQLKGKPPSPFGSRPVAPQSPFGSAATTQTASPTTPGSFGASRPLQRPPEPIIPARMDQPLSLEDDNDADSVVIDNALRDFDKSSPPNLDESHTKANFDLENDEDNVSDDDTDIADREPILPPPPRRSPEPFKIWDEEDEAAESVSKIDRAPQYNFGNAVESLQTRSFINKQLNSIEKGLSIKRVEQALLTPDFPEKFVWDRDLDGKVSAKTMLMVANLAAQVLDRSKHYPFTMQVVMAGSSEVNRVLQSIGSSMGEKTQGEKKNQERLTAFFEALVPLFKQAKLIEGSSTSKLVPPKEPQSASNQETELASMEEFSEVQDRLVLFYLGNEETISRHKKKLMESLEENKQLYMTLIEEADKILGPFFRYGRLTKTSELLALTKSLKGGETLVKQLLAIQLVAAYEGKDPIISYYKNTATRLNNELATLSGNDGDSKKGDYDFLSDFVPAIDDLQEDTDKTVEKDEHTDKSPNPFLKRDSQKQGSVFGHSEDVRKEETHGAAPPNPARQGEQKNESESAVDPLNINLDDLD
jgi:hypothetical protein